MNLRERLAKLKGEFMALKKGIENGDKDAIERATELKKEIEEVRPEVLPGLRRRPARLPGDDRMSEYESLAHRVASRLMGAGYNESGQLFGHEQTRTGS